MTLTVTSQTQATPCSPQTEAPESRTICKIQFFNQSKWDSLEFNDTDALKDIETIEFSQNDFPTVPENLFTEFPQLKNLMMENVGLTKLSNKSFMKGAKLEKIIAPRNSISILTSDTFQKNGNLIEIDFSKNKISTIELETFFGLGKLEILDLSENAIVTLLPGVFVSLAKLKVLNLTKNSIESLEQGIFEHLPIDLYLKDNRIDQISRYVFVDRKDKKNSTVHLEGNICVNEKINVLESESIRLLNKCMENYHKISEFVTDRGRLGFNYKATPIAIVFLSLLAVLALFAVRCR